MQIFGIQTSNITKQNLLNEITKFEVQKIVFTPNPEILLNAKKNNDFSNTLKKADYLINDGIGLYLAAQILEKSKLISFLKLPIYVLNLFIKRKDLYAKYGERICGSDLTKELLEYSEKNNITVSIIDPKCSDTTDNKYISQQNFNQSLKNIYPNLNFDYYLFEESQKAEIYDQISKSNSKIAFSTMGMIKQENQIIEIMEVCPNIKLGLGVGSSFDYFTGFQKRAPAIFTKLGFEWLYRLIIDKNKIRRIKRIYNATVVFLIEIFK